MKYVLFAIAALVLVNVINANADKLLQDNADKLLQESCPLSTCQK